MKLLVDKILDIEGERIALDYSLDLTDYELWDTKPFFVPVKVSGEAYNRCNIPVLEYTAVYKMRCRCARCDREFERSMEHSQEYTLSRNHLSDDDDSYLVVDDDTIDIDELVLSDILLSLPLKMLCMEDCKGLCPVCGHYLGDGDCGCTQNIADPRLESLAKLLNKEN